MTTGNSDGSEGEGLLPRVIADAAAAAIGLPLGPAGSLVTAVATPYLEAVTQWAFERFAEDAKERVLGMLARAWHSRVWILPGSLAVSAKTNKRAC